ncbi:uncharacterized protein RJT21DRAFT_2246 [Scheffersomyces amazonensis]|uniref:uncharacterized protein n=1 Tax=Scheffersomyces amazonensis TaxID=1078765 RepID=UPI00315CEE57
MKKLQLNPIVLMIAAKVNKNPNNNEQDDNSSDEVDNDLKELIMGTEEMTYGEDFFFDANPVNNETLSAPVSEPNITSSTNSIVASTDLNSRFQTNHLIPSSAPIMATTLYDDRGNTYLLQPSGYVLPVSKPNALIKPKTKRTKKRMFYHMPIPTTRNTPTEKLVESHIKVLEVVNFDEILDQTSTSRYKDLDTSTFVLHNSNISSKASSFKSSIAKNSLNSSIELSNSSKSSIEPTSSSEQIGKSSSPPLPDLKEE